MHVGTYPTKNFATFGPSELQPPFTEASIQCLHILSSLYSTGQTSDPIHHLTIQQSPVFLLNSRHSLFPVILIHFFINIKKKYIKILLIPKLQSQFAEFLQHNSLKHLSLLNLFTCVSFSTVNININFLFSKIYPISNKIINI